MSTRQRAFLLGTASYLAVAVLIPRLGFAEVATDGTMGRQVTLRGGNIEIGADLGQQRGGNLFHSFRKFDVETKGKVTLTGPDGQECDRPGHRRRALLDRWHPGFHHPRRRPLPAQPGRHLVRPGRAPGREGLVPRQHRGRAELRQRRDVQRARHGRQHALHGRAGGVRLPGGEYRTDRCRGQHVGDPVRGGAEPQRRRRRRRRTRCSQR